MRNSNSKSEHMDDKNLISQEVNALIEQLNSEMYVEFPFLIFVPPPKKHELAEGNPFKVQSNCV